MATLVLQSAGAALGGALGGPIGGVIGRAAGALFGRTLDERIFGRDRLVRGPRLEQAQILASGDGADMPRVYGRARIGGQIVWATRFEEVVNRQRQGGKGGGPRTTVEEYSYFANFAVGICEGPIAHVGRIWADGAEIDRARHEIRIYRGDDVQAADPLIEARQGEVPAFRGTAYAVFERFALADFGNRIPQLSFEVIRPVASLDRSLKAVTIIPGATEFGYAPTAVPAIGPGAPVNRNNLVAESDWQASIDELQALCPALQSVALVVTWFGDDLRAGSCMIMPGVESTGSGGTGWSVNGVGRAGARLLSQAQGRPAFGGTPSDNSVIAAIADLKARGLKVVLYPFLMMDIPPGNALPAPDGAASQPAFPWRGRITCVPAQGLAGTADRTAAARAQVDAFAGAAGPGDFHVAGQSVSWIGATDWGYRRMILHCAHLAAAAGGVDGFLIGSELEGLTFLRDETGAFPFVDALRALATDVRAVLGPSTRITYGANWSEYSGYRPADAPGDMLFHLDALWSDPAIDAVGIDNYLPLTDWRLGGDPGDAEARSQTDPARLAAAIAGGEYFDWFYADEAARAAGVRTPIADGQGEPWLWRAKDLAAWWGNFHHERIGGIRQTTPTAWQPGSKPVWFTELGCPATTMGANEPNVFPDSLSSEGSAPHHSTGARADLVQNRFLSAHLTWWNPLTPGLPAGRNPVSSVFGRPMVEPENIFPWAWDARPFPQFPSNAQLWSDGPNWHRGHWLNGRIGGCPLDDLLGAICADFGISGVEAQADGFCDGYVVPGPMPARGALAPLAAVFDAAYREEGAARQFLTRAYAPRTELAEGDFVRLGDRPLVRRDQGQESEIPHELDIGHSELFGGYDSMRSRSLRVGTSARRAASMDLPAILPPTMAEGLAEARLRDLWIGRETLEIAVTRRHLALTAGDLVRIASGAAAGEWRIEAIEDGEARELRLRAVAPIEDLARPGAASPAAVQTAASFTAPQFLAMNLPLSPENIVPTIHCAVAAVPWARSYGIWSSPASYGFALRALATAGATVGSLVAPLAPGPEGRLDRAHVIALRLGSGSIASQTELLLLNGANAAAVLCANGEWEILQFRDAVLTSNGEWRLSQLLRGQAGTDPAMRAGAAVGSPFVVLDSAIVPVALAQLEAGLAQNWRCGPASDPVSAGTFAQVSHTHAALAQRPLSPVHLSARRLASGDVELAWIRRSRIDADSWDAPDIPLGEAVEAWQVQILRPGGEVARTLSAATGTAAYALADQLYDFGAHPGSVRFAVAQLGANGAAGAAREATVALQ